MDSFFERSCGGKSMMRLLAFLGFCLGGCIAIWGMILITIAVTASIEGNASAPQLIGSLMFIVTGGLGLAAGGQALKVIQQRGEIKDNPK